MEHILKDFQDEVEDMKIEFFKKLYDRLEKAEEPKQQLYLIKEISKNNGEIPELKKYLKSYDKDLKAEAYKQMFKNEDLIVYKEYVLNAFKDENPKVRKLAFDWYAEDIGDGSSLTIEELKNKDVFEFFLEEYNVANQISFVKNFIKHSSEEDVKELKEKTKDKINSEAYIILELKDKSLNILKGEFASKNEIKEASIYLCDFMYVDDLIELLKKLNNPLSRKELSKAIANMNNAFNFSLKQTIEFLNEEKDLDVMVNLMRLSKKIYKSEGLEIEHIDRLINSDNSKYQIQGFNFAIAKDVMNYIDFARQILLTSIDENLIYAASKYLLHFMDYKLSEHVAEFISSKSKKLKSLALDIIKKLKLTSKDDYVYKIADDEKNPISIRKKALNTLIKFKAHHLSHVFTDIAFNEEENIKLRETALKGVLLFNPELL